MVRDAADHGGAVCSGLDVKPVIPDAALQHHIAVLGKTGRGKTSTCKLLVERLVATGARVCVLDPIKSDWWGITASADGKKPGLPFHILGGPHGHVPLHSGAGKAIGDLVGSGKLPLSIIDMADFEAGGLQRFFVDFAPALLRTVRGVLYLVMEEAHEFAPKERAGFTAENMAIHFAKKLATAGRSKGVRLIVATQATQLLHNRVLGSCETMIVHGFTAPADQEPVVKWLKANTTKVEVAEVEGSLSRLATGEAWVVSGEAQLFVRTKFPRIHTYDNSATPTDDLHQHQVKTAPVDQDKLRAIIGDAVKDAEARDPVKLQAEIRRLTAELAKKPAAEKVLAVDHDAVRDAEQRGHARGRGDVIAGAKAFSERFITLSSALTEQARAFSEALKLLASKTPSPKAPPRVPDTRKDLGDSPARATTPAAAAGLATAQRKILNALAFLERVGISPADRTQVSLFADLSPTAGHTNNMFGGLRTAALIEYPTNGMVVLTDAGRALADPGQVPQSAEEMQRILLAKVAAAQRKILTVLIAAYPNALDRREASERAGLAPDAGHTNNMYGGLRSMGLIEYPAQGRVVAQPVLFLEAR